MALLFHRPQNFLGNATKIFIIRTSLLTVRYSVSQVDLKTGEIELTNFSYNPRRFAFQFKSGNTFLLCGGIYYKKHCESLVEGNGKTTIYTIYFHFIVRVSPPSGNWTQYNRSMNVGRHGFAGVQINESHWLLAGGLRWHYTVDHTMETFSAVCGATKDIMK